MSDAAQPESGSEAQPVFRRGNIDDADAMLRVIQAAFPEWPAFDIDVSPIDHLRWKMSQPESLRRDLHAIVEIDHELVACQVRWRSRISVGGDEVPFELGADMAVHPSAQGRGLSRLIRNRERERMYNSRVIGFDTAPHHERMLALQADDVYIKRSIPLWVRTFDLRTFLAQHRANGGDSHLTRAVVAAGGQILRGRARTSRVKRRPRVMETPTARSITIARASSFDERATELWLRVEPEFDPAMRRFADFLNWRYLDPRAGRISVFTAAEGDRLLGFAAFRTSGPEARVLDLVTDPTAPAVGRELLVQGAAAARQAGCRYLVCLLPQDHRDERALRDAGFLPTGAAHAINVARDRYATHVPVFNEVLLDPAARLHITFGDFDHG